MGVTVGSLELPSLVSFYFKQVEASGSRVSSALVLEMSSGLQANCFN
jgi:hypothetical protein